MDADRVGGPDGVEEDGAARTVGSADLAAAAGASTSLLSCLEAGLRRPTLDVLPALVRGHRLTLDDLVGAPPTGEPRTHPRPSVRYGMTWLPLTGRPAGIQAYKAILPAGSGRDGLEQRSHEGYGWLYVLDGRVRLRLGDHDLVLAAGEVAELDTRTPHAFTDAGDAPAEMLVLIGPQGQHAHVRARPRGSAAGTSRV